jgi:hypothetical protein
MIEVSSSSPFGVAATEMKENDRVIPSGPFKGKKIEFATTTGVDMLLDISEDFMKKIFNFEPKDYLISDESSLYDFTGLDEMELTDIQKIIEDVYDVDVSDIESGNLLEIFKRIHHSKFADPP